MSKANTAWDAVEKEISYFERQCELFTASLSSFISYKTTLTLMNSSSSAKVVPFEVEVEFFSRHSSSEAILKQIEKTLYGIESKIESFISISKTDAKEQIQLLCEDVLEKCRNQFSLCQRACDSAFNEQISSEEKSKSLLSLVIHRPFIWDLQRRLFPDIKSLISK